MFTTNIKSNIYNSLFIVTLFIIFSGIFINAFHANKIARQYNQTDGPNSNGFNPIVNPGHYIKLQKMPWLLHPHAYTALARQAAIDGQLQDAINYASKSLQSNPANGEAALTLFNLYTQPYLHYIPPADPVIATEDTSFIFETLRFQYASLDTNKTEQIAQLASVNNLLHPTNPFTQSALAEYWLYQKQPHHALPSWHILLSLYPDYKVYLFPILEQYCQHKQMFEEADIRTINSSVWWQEFRSYCYTRSTS